MNSARKAASFWLLFIFTLVFISPLCAENSLSEEFPPGEETSVAAEQLPAEDSLLAENPLPGEEAPLAEDHLPAEEPPSAEDRLLAEEPPSAEDHLPAEDPPPAEESPLSEEALPGEESLLAEEFRSDEDFLLDDESIFFEAPPIIIEAPPFIGPRSFDEIFPGLSRSQKAMAKSNTGLRYSFAKAGSQMLIPNPDSGIDLLSSVMKKKPSHIVEALVLVQYNSKKELDMLDIYNALGKIENIKDQSIPFNGRDIHIFVETTRLESARNRKPVSDPLPADDLPLSDTMYLRFTDAFFGTLFIRGDVSISLYGMTYSMTNFTDVRYSFFPIMKAERVSIIIYLEPVKEGILVYSVSGFYLPGLIANSANLSPNIDRRITIFLNWIIDGLRKQESAAAEQENGSLLLSK